MARNQNKDNQLAIDATERQRRALELRKAGYGFQIIADQLGYKDPSGAYRAIRAALKKTLQEPADEVRRIELERLDKMLAGLWPQAIKGHTFSVDRVLAIMDRRAKLLGLDAPLKIDIEQRIRQDAESMGLDPDEAVREAQGILHAGRS